jgi:hypothetical protein
VAEIRQRRERGGRVQNGKRVARDERRNGTQTFLLLIFLVVFM